MMSQKCKRNEYLLSFGTRFSRFLYPKVRLHEVRQGRALPRSSAEAQALFPIANQGKSKAENLAQELTRGDVDVITRIARERAELLQQLKAALVRGDTLLSLQLGRQYCGLPEETAQ
jgi:hypothetical protein